MAALWNDAELHIFTTCFCGSSGSLLAFECVIASSILPKVGGLFRVKKELGTSGALYRWKITLELGLVHTIQITNLLIAIKQGMGLLGAGDVFDAGLGYESPLHRTESALGGPWTLLPGVQLFNQTKLPLKRPMLTFSERAFSP